MRARKNGRAAKARKNGRAAAADIEEMFRAINTPRPDPAGEAGKAAALAALVDGSLLAPGVDGLERLGEAVRRGYLDDASEVSDATRRQIIDHVAARLRAGGAAEKIAAAQVMDSILLRPNVRARAAPPGAEPSASGAGGAEPAPGGGGPAPLDPGSNGAPPGGRDRRGQFARGNKLGRGNPVCRRMAQLRAALCRDLDEGKMEALGGKLYSLALAGDLEAAKLVLAYACGKPQRTPDADTLDAHEYAVLSGGPSLARLWFGANEVVDPRLACSIWRKLSAADADAATTQLLNSVESEPGRFAKDLDRVRARAAAAGR
jgi:hypothetical protein